MQLKNFKIISSSKSFQTPVVVAMSVYSGDTLPWVRQSVESIVKQSYNQFVFIVVIDGDIEKDVFEYLTSAPKTQQNIVIVQGEVQKGLSSCMNFAAELAKKANASYFFRMDADDIAKENRLKQQLQYFEDNPQVSILGSALIEIDEEGNRVGNRRFPEHHHLLVNLLPLRCPINHPTVALRMSVFDAGYKYDESKMNTQDYFFWVTLAKAGFKFANIREPLLNYRRVKGFYKRRGKSKSLNEFKARFFAMKTLKGFSIKNVFYACFVLMLRMMPSFVIKLAYKFDRKFIHGNTNNIK